MRMPRNGRDGPVADEAGGLIFLLVFQWLALQGNVSVEGRHHVASTCRGHALKIWNS